MGTNQLDVLSDSASWKPKSDFIRPPSPSNRRVVWLFEAQGRGPPRRGFSLYLLLSALGVAGALVLLILGAMLHAQAASLRFSALAWVGIFGAARITLFWRK